MALWNVKTKNIPCAEAEWRHLKVTAYSSFGSGTVELQVTEYSVCGSGTASHSIFCVWNISGSLCNGPKDAGAQGRRPLDQSHLGGAVIYCSILAVAPTGFFVFVFSVIIKQ